MGHVPLTESGLMELGAARLGSGATLASKNGGKRPQRLIDRGRVGEHIHDGGVKANDIGALPVTRGSYTANGTREVVLGPHRIAIGVQGAAGPRPRLLHSGVARFEWRVLLR